MGMSSGGGGGSRGPTMGITNFNSTSTVRPPEEVLKQYRSVWNDANRVAATPWENYSNDPNAFVAGLNSTQLGGMQGIIDNVFGAQPYVDQGLGTLGSAMGMYGNATGMTNAAGNATVADNNIAAMSDPYYGMAGRYTQNAAEGPGGFAAANPYFDTASGNFNSAAQGTNQVGSPEIAQYLSPYQSQVIDATMGLLGQQNESAMSGALGNVIRNGGFGGDRAGVMMANQQQQNTLANAKILGDLNNQNYAQALNTAVGQRAQNQADLQRRLAAGQAQAGVGAQAGQLRQADLQRQLAAGQQMAGIGTAQRGAYEQQQAMRQADLNRQLQAGQNLGSIASGMGQIGQAQGQLGLGLNNSIMQNLQSQVQAGTLQQQTEQAKLDAMYNQWLQEKAYPFLTTQWRSDITGGLGPLYGSTTDQSGTSTSFNFPLSDPRLKTGVGERRAFRDGGSADMPEVIGETFDGQPIYRYSLMGGPAQLGLMADEVAQRNPESVFDLGGVLAMDYAGATDDAAEIGHELNANHRAHREGGGSLASLVAAQGQMFGKKKEQSGLGGAGGPGFVPKGGGKYGQMLQPHSMNVPKAEAPPIQWNERRNGIQGLQGLGEQAKGLFQMGKDLKNFGGFGGLGDISKAFDTAAQTGVATAAEAPKTVAENVPLPPTRPNDLGGTVTDVHSAANNLASIGDKDWFSTFFAHTGGTVPHKGGGGSMMPFADEQKGFIPVGGRGRNAIPFGGAGDGKNPFPVKTLDNSPPPQMMVAPPAEDVAKAASGQDKQQGGGGEGGGGGGGGQQAQQMMKGAMDLMKQGQSFMGKAGSTAGQATGALGQGVSGAAQGAAQGAGGLASNLGSGAGSLASSAASGAQGIAGGAHGLASGAQGLASAAAPAAQGLASAAPAAASALPSAATAAAPAAAASALPAAAAPTAAAAAAPAAAAGAAGAALPAAAAPVAGMAAAAAPAAAAAAGAGAAGAAGGAGLLGLLPLLFLSDPSLKTGVGRKGFATDGGVEGETLSLDDPRLNEGLGKPVDAGDLGDAPKAAVKEQKSEAPSGTHYQQFGPNRILMDDKTGAAVAQLKGWRDKERGVEPTEPRAPSNLGEASNRAPSSGEILAHRQREKDAGSSSLGSAPHRASEATPMPRIDVPAEARGDGAGGLYSPEMNKYMDALHRIESGGYKNPYAALGVVTRNGDRAYGKYQIMGNNIPQWGRLAGYDHMTINQFMNDPEAQERIARTMYASYLAKGASPQEAAMMWLGGPGYAKHMGARDAHGTDVNKYAAMFNKYMGVASGDMPTMTAGGNFDAGNLGSRERSFMASANGLGGAGGLNPPTMEEDGLDALARIAVPLLGAVGGAASQAGNGGLAMALGGLGGAGSGASSIASADLARQKFNWEMQLQNEKLKMEQEQNRRAEEQFRLQQEQSRREAEKWEIDQSARRRHEEYIRKLNGLDAPAAAPPAAAPAPAPMPPPRGGNPPMTITPGPTGPETPTSAPDQQPPVVPQKAASQTTDAPEVKANQAVNTQNQSGIDWSRVAPTDRIPDLKRELAREMQVLDLARRSGENTSDSVARIKAIQDHIDSLEEAGFVRTTDDQWIKLPGKGDLALEREAKLERQKQEIQSKSEIEKQTALKKIETESDLAKDQLKELRSRSDAANGALIRIAQMKHEYDQLPSTGWAAPGGKAELRFNAIKTLNAGLVGLGFEPLYKDEVATAEALQKDTFRLGAELARTLGGREPGFIVQQAVSANPGIENTKAGFKRIVAGLEQMQVYEMDKNEFYNTYYRENGTLNGVEKAFRQAHPREEYVARSIAASVPQGHRDYLLNASPEDRAGVAKAIDKEYGAGVAKALMEGGR